jgi:transcriptional regulator with XRE-family HTH domain
MKKNININELEPWRVNLHELRSKQELSYKQIAEKENLSEKSVMRVFTGEAKSPGVELIRKIIHALDGRWSEIFSEGDAVIAPIELITAQIDCEKAMEVNKVLSDELREAQRKIAEMEAQISTLSLKLDHQDQVISLLERLNKALENKC